MTQQYKMSEIREAATQTGERIIAYRGTVNGVRAYKILDVEAGIYCVGLYTQAGLIERYFMI